MKTCKKHGSYQKEQCPECCLHKGQIYLDNGPKCFDCGRDLGWIQAAQLKNLESYLLTNETNCETIQL